MPTSASRAKVAVMIPAYNEETSVGLVLEAIPKKWMDQIVVVDNGSTDTTAKVAQSSDAEVVSEPRRGYGQARLTGIAHVKNDTDIVVFMDADSSDHPEQLPDLLGPIVEHGADMVIGSRMLGGAGPGALLPQARWGNRLACFLMRLITVEMQIKAARMGLSFREVSVKYRKRVGVSKITGTVSGTLRAGWKILYTIVK